MEVRANTVDAGEHAEKRIVACCNELKLLEETFGQVDMNRGLNLSPTAVCGLQAIIERVESSLWGISDDLGDIGRAARQMAEELARIRKRDSDVSLQVREIFASALGENDAENPGGQSDQNESKLHVAAG